MYGEELTADIVIVGSGVGGATFARTVAPCGAKILIVERGEYLKTTPEMLNEKAIHRDGAFIAQETWYENHGKAFSPWIYYYVGGNTKFFGAVMPRYRKEDFEPVEHIGGISPAWPFLYEKLEPYYGRAEELFRVRGTSGQDSCEPPRSQPYPHAAVPDEPSIAAVRQRLEQININTHSTPLCADEQWLDFAPITWDSYPNTGDKKADAENGPLREALAYENVDLLTDAIALRLHTGGNGKEIVSLEVNHRGEKKIIKFKWIILSAGAVNSAALLLQSADDKWPDGLANSSRMVGGNFMWHHCSFMMTIDPRVRNDAVYQKTISINDFYFEGGENNRPLGHVQLCGKISPPMVQAIYPRLPEYPLRWACAHSVDWFLLTEDLPVPENRIRVDSSGRIHFHLDRPNDQAHIQLVQKMKKIFRDAGYPLIFTKPFGINYPTHQCGTVRIGSNSAEAPLDPYCRSFDHPNLWVVDASVLPTSAAVNPTLTIVAQALRAGEHWLDELGLGGVG